MIKEKRQSFVHGAAVLAAAGIAVKVIGALYKIPLGAILGPVGMANFSISYNIYALLFVLSTAGVPSAVSKLISEASAQGENGQMYRIYKISYLTFSLVGFFGFSVMFFGADFFAKLMGSSDAAVSIRAISPAVLFVSMSAINRGYFQGRSNMYPTAVSEVLEALGKLAVGLVLALYLKRRGMGDGAVAAGAVFGVSAGAFFSTVYFSFCRDNIRCRQAPSNRRKRAILKELIGLAVPITLGAAVISLTNVIDSAIVLNLLRKSGFSEYSAKWLYGSYNYAATVFNLPSALITTLGVSLIPAISGAFVKRDYISVDRIAGSGMSVGMMISIPAACGIAALSYGILHLLYGMSVEPECIKASAHMLTCLSLAVVPLSLVTLTNSVHQALGRPNVPVMSMLAGAAVKIISNLILVRRVDINIYGAAISTVLCYVTIAILNIAQLKKYPFIDISILRIFGGPVFSGVVTFVSSRVLMDVLSVTFSLQISTILSVFGGVFACLACTFVTLAMGGEEEKFLFHGKNIFKFFNND